MASNAASKMETLTRALRRSIKSDFGNHLKALGYEQYKAKDSSGLHYFFRRKVADHWDLLQVQFDKSHRPKFVLEFGQFTIGGIVDRYGNHVRDDDVRCHMLPKRGRLYKSKVLFFWIWFGVSKSLASVIGHENSIAREVRRLTILFSQVERWFVSGVVGPCIDIEDLRPIRTMDSH